MDVREKQYWKQLSPKLVTEKGILMVSDLQREKQPFPKLVTLYSVFL